MKISSNNPIENTHLKEITHSFMGFCSFVSILHNKKINLPNIFILCLKDKKLRSFFKELLDLESDYEYVQMFLFFDPSLYKSKYIMKYVNSKKKILIN
jgi:hypothetical protein